MLTSNLLGKAQKIIKCEENAVKSDLSDRDLEQYGQRYERITVSRFTSKK